MRVGQGQSDGAVWLRILSAILLSAAVAASQDLLKQVVPSGGTAELEFEESAPEVSGWVADFSPVVMEELTALRVVGSEEGGAMMQTGEVVMSGMTVARLGDLAGELGQWIGRPLTEDGLDRLTEVILRHYDDEDRPMNEVFVPAQEGEGGRLRVDVVEGRVGAIGVSQLRHFNERILRRAVRVKEGELLRGSHVRADAAWLSRNPFRKANLLIAPGESVSVDLLLQVDEVRPWRLYAGYENTGTESVGENRWFVGGNWGNAFGLDHVLGYQFTAGDALDDLQAHALSWEIPFHQLHQTLKLTGAWADISATQRVGGVVTNSEGTSWQLTAMYGFVLPELAGWTQELSVGAEFKRADSVAQLGAIVVPGAVVEVLQAAVDWEASRTVWGGRARVSANLRVSPGELTSRNGAGEFEAFRVGADPAYFYGRFQANWDRPLVGEWEVRLAATAQVASGALLPTEQLALGGSRSVRGYGERILLADAGYFLRGELWSPAWRGGEKLIGKDLTLRGVGFLDHGLGWQENEGATTLTGAGLGALLEFGPSASLRIDAGWGLENGEGAQLHAGLFVAY